jgi:hypothetical protein
VIELDRLIALALGELDPGEESEVEEHVLACDECAATLARLLEVGDAVRDLVGAGGIALVGSGQVVDRLERAGLVSRTYRIAPGQTVPCSVGATDIYAVAHLEVDLAGVRRVDLVSATPRGTERVEDIPFDPARGFISILTPSAFIRTMPSMHITCTLVAVDADGERVLGEYRLDHTAFCQ